MLIRFAPIVSLALLVGCTTVGPTFSAPPTYLAAQTSYRHGGSGSATSNLPTQWWRIFGDPTLDGLEQRALRDNPNVKIAAERLLQVQAQLRQTRALQLPTLNFDASAANAHTSSTTPEGQVLGRRSISGNEYGFTASMSYELDLWGKIKRLNEAADAQVLAAEYDRDDVLLLLSAQVATTYWQLCGLNAELAIIKRSVNSRYEMQQLVEDRFNAGFDNELNVSRARVESTNAENDLNEVGRQRNLLEHGLAVLIGASPSLPISIASEPLALLPEIPSGLSATLLAQRPDLAESLALLRAANAQIGVAESAFFPSLQLTGAYGYASETLRDLAQSGSRQFSLGPLVLALPFFDGGRNRANLALARARYQEALAAYQTKLLNALCEVEDALSNTEHQLKQAETQAVAQQETTRVYKVALRRYEHGLSNYLDVIAAQHNVLDASRAEVQIRTRRLLAITAVARALGGGWQSDSCNPLQGDC